MLLTYPFPFLSSFIPLLLSLGHQAKDQILHTLSMNKAEWVLL